MGLWGGKQLEQIADLQRKRPPPSTGALEPCRGECGLGKAGQGWLPGEESPWPMNRQLKGQVQAFPIPPDLCVGRWWPTAADKATWTPSGSWRDAVGGAPAVAWHPAPRGPECLRF